MRQKFGQEGQDPRAEFAVPGIERFMMEKAIPVPAGIAAGRKVQSPLWTLALCWKDEPRPVNLPADADSLPRRFEVACRNHGAQCLVDQLPLPPARGVRSLLKPVPRVQALVTSLWPDPAALQVLDGNHREPSEASPGAPLLTELLRCDHTCFWVPGFAIPTLAQTEQRLARTQVTGTSALLGSLRAHPVEPPDPSEHLGHPEIAEIRRHEERLREDPRYSALQYDRRCFHARTNTSNGDVKPGLRFDYHQEDGAIWAWYEGDGVFLGSLTARKSPTGALRMAYQHLNAADEIRAGQCLSYPEFLTDGRLRMYEFWRWTSGDGTAGASEIEECEGTTLPRRVS